MKTSILQLFLFIGLLALQTNLLAQNLPATQSCESNCFITEIIKAEKNGSCTNYEFKVSYLTGCDHGLSHYTVDIPCGDLNNLSNSKGWKQEYGYDPTTKLKGFKIDNIPDFGKTSLKSFTVKFTLCPDGGRCSNNNLCVDELKCWQPVVAYKAATCVFYDTLESKLCQNLSASLQQKNISCFGAADGNLAVVVAEGKAPYTYLWSNGASTSSISNLVAGNYSVVIRDASGVQKELAATISQPEEIVISGIISNVTCNGQSNGAIDVSVLGGQGNYTYLWSNGATSQDLASIVQGTYSVTVKDSVGCSLQKSFSITNGSQVTMSATAVLPSCTQSNGSIDITVSGGTEPYTYLWANGATTEDIQNLSAGIYKVIVKDGSGCSTEFTYSLRENNTLKLTSIVKQTTCLDDGSGAIDLSVTGGTAPYTYIWTNGSISEDLTNLIAGVYRVTVTDANGCSATLAISVSKKTFQVNSQVIQPSCNQGGSISITPGDGVAPYTYSWDNGETGNSITDLEAGIYKVTITDATGCTRLLTYSIENPVAITSSASVSNSQCNAEGSYNIDLSVSGGNAPYTFVWSNGATTEDLNSLQSGTYTVIIADTNGCSTTKEVLVAGSAVGWSCLITQPDSIAVCNSINNTLGTSITGATSYQWTVESSDNKWIITSGASSQSIGYTAGDENSNATFTLTIVKDGCTQTCSYTATTCTSDDNGNGDGGDDGDGDGTDNEMCDECFDSSVTLISSDGLCKTYEVIVSTNGNCRHELSHWDIAIPCGNVTNTWNSGGWKMEIGKDPTTGLNGLKVDDIDGFGKEPATLKVTFTICGDYACKETLKDWAPVVAYKAGQCIAIDTLGHDDDNGDDGVKVCAYPNPFHGNLKFDWKCNEDDYVELEIIDKCGRQVHQVYKGNVRKGESYSFECNDENLKEDMYIYRFYSGKRKTQYGKLIKKH
ncbi:MAG TPA: hypothetical protein PK281_08700 [Flavobacteriales bacterium]|nr:hypothetical protein [Flavobacteriales bacterium]